MNKKQQKPVYQPIYKKQAQVQKPVFRPHRKS